MRNYLQIPNSGVIELYEDVAIPLTLSVADIRDPKRRNSTWSKTVRVPGTENNNKILRAVFEINIDASYSYNPNKKIDVTLVTEGMETTRGYMQLLMVNDSDAFNVEYECAIFGKLSDIYREMGSMKLTELDFSEFDHTFSKSVQKDSWDTQIYQGGSPVSFELGKGYVYPLIDYGHRQDGKFASEHLYPAIYLKQYIDKIFDYTGFTYSSNFFDSDFFKRLIVASPVQGLTLSEDIITARSFRASLATVQAQSIYRNGNNFTLVYDDDSTSPNTDPSGLYNTSTGYFTPAVSGKYNVEVNTSIAIQVHTGSGVGTCDAKMFGYLQLKESGAAPSEWYTSKIDVDEQFSTIEGGKIYIFNNLSMKKIGIKLYSTKTYHVRVHFVDLKVQPARLGDPPVTNVTMAINLGSFVDVRPKSNEITPSDTMEVNNTVPKNVKMADMLSSVIKAFNLYIEPDADVSNKLIIEPRDDYYTTDVVDWTDKADDTLVQIDPMGELDAKKYLFKYADDKDYYNKLYQDKYDKTYGEREIEVDNDFHTDDYETELIFANTPLVGLTDSDMIIPRIYNYDEKKGITPTTAKPRLLYYGGVMSTNTGYKYGSEVLDTYSVESLYGYAGHVDNPISPSLDLCFGYPRELYYDADIYTTNNLYTAYHKRFIEEITDQDSRIVTMFIKLTQADIYRLNFRKQYFIKNTFYRLNKVDSYDPISEEKTRVEFLKMRDRPAPDPGTLAVGGWNYDAATFNGDSIDGLVHSWDEYIGDGNTGASGLNPIFGSNNNIDGVGAMIVAGDQNNSGPGASNFAMLAASGCTILPGVTSAMVMGVAHKVKKSNSGNLFGVVMDSGAIYTAYNVIEGGYNEVKDYTSTSQYNVIEGGYNEIRNHGATSPVHMIEGGLNTVDGF